MMRDKSPTGDPAAKSPGSHGLRRRAADKRATDKSSTDKGAGKSTRGAQERKWPREAALASRDKVADG